MKVDIAELETAMRYNAMFLVLVIGLLVKPVFFPAWQPAPQGAILETIN